MSIVSPILAAPSILPCWWLFLAGGEVRSHYDHRSWHRFLPSEVSGAPDPGTLRAAACLSHGRAAPPGQVMTNHNIQKKVSSSFVTLHPYALRKCEVKVILRRMAMSSYPALAPWWLPWPSQAREVGETWRSLHQPESSEPP